MKKVTKKILKDEMVSCDDVGYSSKYNHFIFKRGYFYTHGMTTKKFAYRVVNELIELGYIVNVIEKSNHFNSWPKDSWFEVRAEVIMKEVA